MQIGFHITDYKIRSVQIYRLALFAFLSLLVFLLVAEWTIGLAATTPTILFSSAISTSLLIVLSYRFPTSFWLRTLAVVAIYIIIETHFLLRPTFFHTLNFWFPFVPIMALIIAGTRSSLVWIGILFATFVFNAYYISNNIGPSYDTTIGLGSYLVTAIIFTSAVMTNSFILFHLLGKANQKTEAKHEELETAHERMEAKRNRLEKYMRSFIAFSKDDSNFGRGQFHLFKSICKTTAATLGVNRVSIWLFDEAQSKLIRHHIHDENDESDEIIELERTQFPVYFRALEEAPYIMASDARTHEHTKEFKSSYLVPLDIYSMLDCPILVDREPIGVICCEQQHQVKEWRVEDTLFIQSFVDFIALSFKNERIAGLIGKLQQKNQELIIKNKEIEIMNSALDTTVRKRTDDLKTQKARLTEYSFINSHLLRAPLSRILGLSEAISKEVSTIKERQLLDALTQSSSELDSIIHKINEVLYSGNGLTREDLERIGEKIKAERQ